MIVKYICPLLAAVILAVIQAQPAGLSCGPLTNLQLQIGSGRQHPYDNTTGYAKAGQWLPIMVGLQTKDRPSDLHGVLRVKTGQLITTYLLSLATPARSHKQYCGYIHLDQRLAHVSIDLYQGQNLLQTLYPKIPFILPQHQELLLVITGNDSWQRLDHKSLKWLYYYSHPQRWGRHVVWTTTMHLASHWAALAAYRAVIFDNFTEKWPGLTRPQAQALVHYLQSGGTVIFCGGDFDIYLRDPKIAPLLPVIPGNLTRGRPSLPGVSAIVPPLLRLRNCTVKSGAEIINKSGEIPLLVSKKIGLGKVLFLATSFSDAAWKNFPEEISPITAAADNLSRSAFASYVMHHSPAIFIDHSRLHRETAPAIHRILRNFTAISVPSVNAIGIFLLSYFIVIFGINYWLWKKIGALQYAWFTGMVLALLFLIVLAGIGQLALSAPLAETRVSVLSGNNASEVMRASHYIALLAEKTHNYGFRAVNASHSFIPYEFEESRTSANLQPPLLLSATAPDTIEQCFIYARDVRNISSQGLISLKGGIHSQLDIQINPANHRVKGTITNRTRYHWRDCWFVLGANSAYLGELPPGATRDINSPVVTDADWRPSGKGLLSDNFNRRVVAQIFQRHGPLASVRERSIPYLLGFCDEKIAAITTSKSYLARSLTTIFIALNRTCGSCPLQRRLDYHWQAFHPDATPVKQFHDGYFSMKTRQRRYLTLYFPYPEQMRLPLSGETRTIILKFSMKQSRRSLANFYLQGYHFPQKKWYRLPFLYRDSQEQEVLLTPAASYICPLTAQCFLRCHLEKPENWRQTFKIAIRPLSVLAE